MTRVRSKNKLRMIATFMVVCILTVGTFSLLGENTVFAARTIAQIEKEKARLEKEEKALKNDIANAQKKIGNEQEKQKLLDAQIKSVEEQIYIYQEKIELVTANIVVKEGEITAKLADIEKNEELFAQRIKAMYISNTSSSVLSTLLESKSFSQFINTTEILTRMSNSDQALIDNLDAEKKDLDKKKEALLAEQADLKKTKADFDAKNKSLDGLYDQSKSAESAAKKNERALWELIEKNKKASEKVEKELDAAIAAARNDGDAPQGQLLWPLPGKSRLTGTFGWRTLFGKPDNHTGIDIPAPAGTNILAAEAGEVIVAQKANSSYGWHIVINHNGGLVSLYGHMSRLDVSVGDKITRGQVIGGVGTTGNSTGNHLHFEIRLNNMRKDPFLYVRAPS